MTIKMTGAEWKTFYIDKAVWPKGSWHDNEEMTIDGAPLPDDIDLSRISDESVLTLEGGVVFLREDDRDGPTLEAHFKRWRKKNTTATIVVEVPKDLLHAVRVAITEAGGKVMT